MFHVTDCGVHNPTTAKPANGDDDDPIKYPWHVSIQRINHDNKPCGGSIINDLMIITSAACLNDFNELTVDDDLLKPTQFDITRITVSLNYKDTKKTPNLRIRSVHCHPRAIPSWLVSK